MLWALQNVVEYKVDRRKDNRKLNFFTFGGSHRELPVLFRGLTQLAGQDTYFFGDLNRLKCLWHQNVKFYDLANFFDTTSLTKMDNEWNKYGHLSKNLSTSQASVALGFAKV